ncbi:ester hydrolase C11orf54 homolog [Macrosteles quadrilineatus]|uniref:ester hydrolase C11orf54 homolog n=1 Tax=Macrosteles quadrilineatus TaxID=74068 RepID=UPI0023E349FD|nr:ester hydrolase C11orf54 homolog [Macrosteles quadrilineatus]XP_054268504.1 ester hydrolase C11orf54 homolog [Macrosteles quadrilineatus]
MVQNPKTLKIEKKKLTLPPLQNVAQALQKGLTSYFESVEVEVVDCPDLTSAPYCLAAPGLCGSTRVVEVGGVSHFMPLYQPDKIYDLRYFPDLLGLQSAAFIGTGAGPFTQGHCCCELLANAYLSKKEVKILNRIAKVTDENDRGYIVELLPANETKFVLMANLFVSHGKPGKVLRIHCKKRLKNYDFPAAVRKCLAQEFQNQHLGLGGVFIVEGSKVRQHIPPKEFSKVPINTSEQLNNWLKFFDMNPPLVFVGTILTDQMDMDMILQHFHSFSQHGEGGHYHYDTTPATVEYTAYFNLAELAVHVDKPPRTSSLSVDSITPTGTSSH